MGAGFGGLGRLLEESGGLISIIDGLVKERRQTEDADKKSSVHLGNLHIYVYLTHKVSLKVLAKTAKVRLDLLPSLSVCEHTVM